MILLHEMREERSPVTITMRCSCGWSATQSRRQNALARAAKLRKACDAHYRCIYADSWVVSNEDEDKLG